MVNLHADPIDFIEADVVAAPVIELRRARRRMIGQSRRVLERAAVFEIDETRLAHISPLGWEHINLTGDYV